MSVAIGTTASIGETLHAALLIALEDLVAALAGNAELPAKLAHGLAG
jgi:hypothetical protein